MIDHNIDVQSVSSRAPKVVRKCESYIGFPVVRTDGRSVGVRSRDCQNFSEWVDFLSYGIRPRARFARAWSSAIKGWFKY